MSRQRSIQMAIAPNTRAKFSCLLSLCTAFQRENGRAPRQSIDVCRLAGGTPEKKRPRTSETAGRGLETDPRLAALPWHTSYRGEKALGDGLATITAPLEWICIDPSQTAGCLLAFLGGDVGRQVGCVRSRQIHPGHGWMWKEQKQSYFARIEIFPIRYFGEWWGIRRALLLSLGHDMTTRAPALRKS
jgi:hypothetical protein